MMKNQNYVFLIIGLILSYSINLDAQQKKNINFFELDVNHGKLFQPNTIKPYTGTAHEKYSNGKKKKRIPIKNGMVSGKVEEWAKNGKKIAELNYLNGVPTGKEKQWYDSGKQKLEVNYQEGVVHGVAIEWYESGAKKSEGEFINGKETGLHKWWFSDGKPDQEINYRNGKANGLVKHWHFNGQQKLEGVFQDGKEQGAFKEWHLNGALEIEGNYNKGLKDGVFKTYSKQSILQTIETYDNGNLVKSLDYRNGSIHGKGDYTQVFNGAESFYTITIAGDNIYPRETKSEVIYVVERYLLQLFNMPIQSFIQKEVANSSEEEILEQFVKFESNYIQEQTGQKIEVNKEIQENKKGQKLIYWNFKRSPAKDETITPRTVVEEHYVSMLCGKEILNLYGVVTKVNKPEEVKAMLLKVAETVEIYNERIELNALNKKLNQ